MKYQLCHTCSENGYCISICKEAKTPLIINTKDRLKNSSKYVPKNVPLLSYAESRKTKVHDNNPLNFD